MNLGPDLSNNFGAIRANLDSPGENNTIQSTVESLAARLQVNYDNLLLINVYNGTVVINPLRPCRKAIGLKALLELLSGTRLPAQVSLLWHR